MGKLRRMRALSAQKISAAARIVPALDSFQIHHGRGWLSAETALVKFVNTNDANGYYRTLGLSPDATREEIRAAYYKLVWGLHPDRGGDEEDFRFVVEIANVLLNPQKKMKYDAVEEGSVYLGVMELEELARFGLLHDRDEVPNDGVLKQYWACLTDFGDVPDEDVETWIKLCCQVSPAAGYRGRVRVAVLEGGQKWPGEKSSPWGIVTADSQIFVVFQRGVEPNRLHALCAMIEQQNHLLKQIQQKRASA